MKFSMSIMLLSVLCSQMIYAQTPRRLAIIEEAVVSYANFPKPGVNFQDISGILIKPEVFSATIDRLYEHYKSMQIDAIVAIDARGFLFAAPLAYNLKLPLVMLRKAGKLPGKTSSHTYNKEYGSDTIEIQSNTLVKGQRVIIIDDSVATGGTLEAAIKLVNNTGAKVIEVACIIDLVEFQNQRKLDAPLFALIKK